jgi:dienelactone hydrolase
LEIATFWVRRGFAFFIATRLGYGATGLEPDVESAGGICAYEPGARVVVTQALAVANYAKSLSFVDRNRIVLVGNSTGGLAMIVASGAVMPGGVIAAVNFAGGHGGGILGPRLPCNQSEISRLASEAGRTARIPMLWLYARHDTLWGPDFPRQWHAAYTKAGGRAEFAMFDRGGHDLVSYPALWGPVVGAYLAKLGMPVRR